MGAGAARAVQRLEIEEPAKAAAIQTVVQAFDGTDLGSENPWKENIEFFKRRVLIASEESRMNDAVVKNSLDQLTNTDFQKFNQYVAENRGPPNEDDPGEESDRLSVISYGEDDDDEDPDKNDKRKHGGKPTRKIPPAIDSLEIQNLESSHADGENIGSPVNAQTSNSTDDETDSPITVKIHPSTSGSSTSGHSKLFTNQDGDNKALPPRRPGPTNSSLSLSTAPFQANYAMDSPMEPPASSPFSELIDQRNKELMGLQKTKIWSYAHNAQLEREVELLQRQLEQLDHLEKMTETKQSTGGRRDDPFSTPKGKTSSSNSSPSNTNTPASTTATPTASSPSSVPAMEFVPSKGRPLRMRDQNSPRGHRSVLESIDEQKESGKSDTGGGGGGGGGGRRNGGENANAVAAAPTDRSPPPPAFNNLPADGDNSNATTSTAASRPGRRGRRLRSHNLINQNQGGHGSNLENSDTNDDENNDESDSERDAELKLNRRSPIIDTIDQDVTHYTPSGMSGEGDSQSKSNNHPHKRLLRNLNHRSVRIMKHFIIFLSFERFYFLFSHFSFLFH